jgi:hypothetical protein
MRQSIIELDLGQHKYSSAIVCGVILKKETFMAASR